MRNPSRGLFVSINLAGQDFGKAIDGRPLHDRVMVARQVMDCDAPERQGIPAPRRRLIEAIPARFRLDQDDPAWIWAGPVAIQGQPVRPEYVMESTQAIGADLTGDLATEDRLIERPIAYRFRIEAAEAFERRPGVPARRSGQVDREAHQALKVIRCVRGVSRDGDRAIDQDDQRHVVARRYELLGHLESHNASHRPAAQDVGPHRMLRAKSVDVP